MPNDNVYGKAEGGTLSERKHLKQNRRGNRRQANRDRSGGDRKRKHNSNTTPNPGPSPSGGYFHPITSAAEFTKEHMDALHMVPVLNCPIEEVIPVSHCPEDLLYRIRPFWSLSREALYNLNYDSLEAAIIETANGSNEPRELRKNAGIRVFGIQFSYRYVTFWRAVIPENYLDLLNDSGDLPPDVFIEMKRSTVLDIEQPDGRYEFSRALLSLLMYWNEQVSGNK
ncbi:hypothetical protein IWQ62_001149 [Dispira parvispora]|uniref:Uncharacterized protein n=1 Tax=Dispira parvispora TaxID=1520584 RepID=A0A9W8AZ32_9FUNG|nr:hypothetical protein IWQ62_001149 [Dispira parvispora]